MHSFITLMRLVVLLGLLCLAGLSRAELAIIAHPDNREPGLSLKQVKRIYLAKSRRFPQGGVVRRGDQSPGQPAREEFRQKVLKLRQKQLDTYWSRLTFTGRGTRPEVVGDDEDMIEWVSRHSDGLGYIDAARVDERVKVLLIVP